MKKVLALVLAVIMVCTMAFAVTLGTGINTSGAQGTTTPTETYPIKAGGTNFYVVLKEGTNLYFNDGKFVPAKNEMQVSITAGSDLVASKGWVKIAKTAQDLANGIVTGTKDTYSYQYQIVLKNDVTRIADGKTYDFSISKIVLNATGWEPQTMWEADEDAGDVIKVDVGYQVVDIDVAVSSTAGTSFDAVPGKINKIASIIKDGSTQIDSATLKVVDNIQIISNTGKLYAKTTLNKGASFYVYDGTMPEVKGTDFVKPEKAEVLGFINNNYNLPMSGVLEQSDVNAAKLYKVYAKGLDGKIASVAATLDNGVLKFTVPALSTVVITTESLIVTASSTTGSTGTTTNPGTGANDVVGVAAALAVVALVSGAAISLKK